ncbi:MAG: hypothetical protein V4751_13980 [Pseudomonadota bacterium]
MLGKIIPITAITILMLTGCNETPSETAEDVAEAREEAVEDIAATREDANQTINNAQRDVAAAQRDVIAGDQNAREELTEAQAEAMRESANANYEVRKAEVEGRKDIEDERCDSLTGSGKDSCISDAQRVLAADLAAAVATRDEVLRAAERRQ